MSGVCIAGYFRKGVRPSWLSLIFLCSFTLNLQAAVFSADQNEAGVRAPDTSASVIIGSVTIGGNRITRERIILRELLVRPGDAVSILQLDTLINRSEENLMNTSLFNFADISYSIETPAADTVDLEVSVTERWYIWPIPYIRLGDRNFNVWWESRDLSRLSYGVNIDWRNFRGRKESLITSLQFGYDQLVGIMYAIPYINHSQTLGLSIRSSYARNHETAYITLGNKPQFYRQESGYARREVSVSLQLSLRPSIYNTHLFDVSYEHQEFSDSVLSLNGDLTPGGKEKFGFVSLHYTYKSDHRDYKHYPLKGYYFDVEVLKKGLPFIDESGIDNLYVMATFRKFWEFHPRIFYAAGLNCKFSSPVNEPYFLTRAIGYDRDVVRAYEYYVADGQSFGILKTNVKFVLIPYRVHEIGFIRSDRFRKTFFALYLNLFADAGYADNRKNDPSLGNDLQNDLLAGYGAGLDFVTYYDIVIRMEYSFNKLGESGFFLHFRAPI